MAINERKRNDVTILDIKGKITIGAAEEALRDAVHRVLEGGSQKVLLNLQGVTTIDSSGVGELVSGYTSATNRGAKIKLTNLPEKINDILTITQLITVFDVYDTEDEAVASFA
ncbi:MAG TPA: STAS domain-containing protein [Thermoanaerobaculia bacterium]|nr:STAS domain-containing protein [Thermoanaerobaculia bacterium]